jgi:hypothetical protein
VRGANNDQGVVDGNLYVMCGGRVDDLHWDDVFKL